MDDAHIALRGIGNLGVQKWDAQNRMIGISRYSLKTPAHNRSDGVPGQLWAITNDVIVYTQVMNAWQHGQLALRLYPRLKILAHLRPILRDRQGAETVRQPSLSR